MMDSVIGRAKTIIVARDGGSARAVVSTVVARVRSDRRSERIRFSDSVEIEEATRGHFERRIIPLVDRIGESLDLTPQNFEMSFVNPGFASAAEIPLRVSGFSADAPAFLSLLSASLIIPIRQDIVSTGHIASSDGDISSVRSIPEKLEAAVNDPGTEEFLMPSYFEDSSLETMSPKEKQRIENGVTRWKGEIEIAQVRHVGDLVRGVFLPRDIVLASLREGFFEDRIIPANCAGPVLEVVRFLTKDNNARFWESLEQALFREPVPLAQELILARSQYVIQREYYPHGFGGRLSALLASLPPKAIRTRGLFPLLPMRECVKWGPLAGRDDYEDFRKLQDAAQGVRFRSESSGVDNIGRDEESSQSIESEPEQILDSVLSQIDAVSLSEHVGKPIEAARISFGLESVVVDSREEFSDILSSYYLHLRRRLGEISTDAPSDTVTEEVYDLLEKGFSRDGGFEAALEEGRSGVHGGMRFVLDRVTEQFKREKCEKRVQRILKESLDPRDWEKRVEVMDLFFKRLGAFLPTELSEKTAAQCVKYYEEIAQAYVRSMEEFRSLIRRL